MTEWIKCSEELPPEFVMIKLKMFGKVITACRILTCKGLVNGIWAFRDGLSNAVVEDNDLWMHIKDYENMRAND